MEWSGTCTAFGPMTLKCRASNKLETEFFKLFLGTLTVGGELVASCPAIADADPVLPLRQPGLLRKRPLYLKK